MTDRQAIADLRALSKSLIYSSGQMTTRAALVDTVIQRLAEGETPWAFPVGTPEYPSAMWYTYTLHDLTGRRNRDGYAHTGLDLNLDKAPWGNVDVGQPVFAVADGEVVDVGFSETYRAGIVLKVDHYGLDLYVRYWHLTQQTAKIFDVGDLVSAGANLGVIDRYPLGYAHCHLDTFWQFVKHNWWFTRHPEIECANPTYILKAHLDPAMVDAMLAKGA